MKEKKNSRARTSRLITEETDDNKIIVGDAQVVLKKIPAKMFRCCITSPPYWGTRDYRVEGQVGAEKQLSDYINSLTEIFNEVMRVLTDDGVLWLNLGDTYTSGDRNTRAKDRKNPARAMEYRPPTPPGLKRKDLIGVPWRVAFSLQEQGWYLRSDIIWHKPNCQPESVKDRPTRAHEYIFFFSKSEKYFYDPEIIREKVTPNAGYRNRRTVWSVNTRPFPAAHFATFPPDLIEPCILASTEAEDFVLDPFLGSGTVGEVCIKYQRRFLGIEINEEYANIARRRLGWE